MKRNNFTKKQALKRMNSQLPQDEKIKKSDFVIHNNSSKEELSVQVENVITYFKTL